MQRSATDQDGAVKVHARRGMRGPRAGDVAGEDTSPRPRPGGRSRCPARIWPRAMWRGDLRARVAPAIPPVSAITRRLSRQLRQLLDIGVIKRITGTYRYYLTKAGRAATAAAEWLKQATVVPAMI